MRRAFVRASSYLVLSALWAGLASPLLAAQVRKVNGPLAHGEGYEAGDVLGFQLSSDGQWAAFLADPDGDDRMEVFGVPVGGRGGPRRLNGPLVAGGSLVEADTLPIPGEPVYFFEPWLAISATNRVVYRGDQDTDGVFELFSAPIDGSAPAQRIGGPLYVGQRFFLEVVTLLAPDGSRAAFLADPEDDDVWELYSTPLDGSAPQTRLNGPLVPGASFEPYRAGVVQLSPDGLTVVYRLDAAVDEVHELFAVPLAGGATPRRLNAPLVAGGDVEPEGLQVTDERVVFVADALVNGRFDLWSVPLDGSAAPLQLASSLGSLRTTLSPDGTRVLYVASDGRLFAVPITGGAATLLGGPTLPAGGSFVTDVRPSPGGRVVARANWRASSVVELFSMPLDGSSAPLVLNPALVAGGSVEEFVLAPAGERLVYRADQETLDVIELYGAPLDGSAPAVKLSTPLPEHGRVEPFPRITPDGLAVLFRADLDKTGTYELWKAPITGGAAPARVNGPLVSGGDVSQGGTSSGAVEYGFGVTADGARILYVADQRRNDAFALWSVRADLAAAPRELSGALELGPVLGDVVSFAWAEGGARLLYSADQIADGTYGLYSAATGRDDARLSRTLLGYGLELRTSPDGHWTAFSHPGACPPPPIPCFLRASLGCAPVDGSAPPVDMSEGLGGRPVAWAFDPGSTRLVFELEVIGQFYSSFGIFSRPTYGGPAVSLTEPPGLTYLAATGVPRIAPDGARVVFSQQLLESSGPDRLWCTPIDRGEAPRILAEAAHGSPAFRAYRITPTAERAVFVASLELQGLDELWQVPLHGARPPTRVGPLLPAHADVDPGFLLLPDGKGVLYLVDGLVDGSLELWRAPLEPSHGQAPVQLSAKAASGGGVAPSILSHIEDPEHAPQFALSPDGRSVVYRADQDRRGVFELFVVASDGRTPARKLHASLGAAPGVPPFAFRFAPDGEHVVYVAPDKVGTRRLHLARLDGLSDPEPLGGTFATGGGLYLDPQEGAAFSFALTPDGKRVVYVADQRVDETFELLLAPLDGGPARVLNSALVPGGDVRALGSRPLFALHPDGTRVAYVADQDEDEVFELYVAELDPRRVRPARLER